MRRPACHCETNCANSAHRPKGCPHSSPALPRPAHGPPFSFSLQPSLRPPWPNRGLEVEVWTEGRDSWLKPEDGLVFPLGDEMQGRAYMSLASGPWTQASSHELGRSGELGAEVTQDHWVGIFVVIVIWAPWRCLGGRCPLSTSKSFI